MRALHCLTLKFSLCSVLFTEHWTLRGPHIAQVPQLPARSTWLTCTVHKQKCPTQPCCVKHRQSSWGKVIAFCWFAVYSVGLVWVGSFLLTVSLLSLFFSPSMYLNAFLLPQTKCFGFWRSHSMTHLPLSQVQTFLGSLQGQRAVMLVTLLALDLTQNAALSFSLLPLWKSWKCLQENVFSSTCDRDLVDQLKLPGYSKLISIIPPEMCSWMLNLG